MRIFYGGPSLKDARKAAGFRTSKEFAEKVGIPPTTYCRYEQKPNHIPMVTAMNLADYFNVTLDAIVGRVCDGSNDESHEQSLYSSLSPRGKAETDRFMAYQAWVDGNMFGEEQR